MYSLGLGNCAGAFGNLGIAIIAIGIYLAKSMGGDDFAFIKENKPGVFIRLGSRTPGGKYGSAHSSTFYSDPESIPTGMLTIVGLVADYLGFEV